MPERNHILDTPIEYLKGIGPKRGELLRKELNILTFRDLLSQYPFRYVDKTKFHKINELSKVYLRELITYWK